MHRRLPIAASAAGLLLFVACSGGAGGGGDMAEWQDKVDQIRTGGAQAPACDGADAVQADSVLAYVRGLEHPNAYEPLNPLQTTAVGQAALALLNGDVAGARAHASGAGVEVTPVVAAGECLWRLGPGAGAPQGQGTLLVRERFSRDVVLEAPHVPADLRTDQQSAMLFDRLHARALLIAGARRCSDATPSGCLPNAGCSAGGTPYRSDAAHSIESAFHAVHLAIANALPTVAVQLHTNLKPTENGDLLVSDGTRTADAGGPGARVVGAIRSAGFDARSCNDPQATVTARALCGLSNTQALASNGAGDACMGDGGERRASGKFLHVEQFSRRLDDLEGWTEHVAQALETAL